MRREGHTFDEIGRALNITGDTARIFVRSRDPKLLTESRQYSIARRARLLALLERDEVGPTVWLSRVKGVMESQGAGDLNILIGSLYDSASAAVAWAEWLKEHR
jgi:hypothetical protein